MNAADIIAIISAFISLLAMIVSVYSAYNARQASLESTLIAMGQAEGETRNLIFNTRSRYEDAAAALETFVDGRTKEELNERDKRRLEPLFKRMNSCIEEYLNAYELACGKYIDKKIDRDRFKKLYIDDIRNLSRAQDPFKSLLHPEGISKFQAFWKVYHEWHDHEK